MGYDGADKLELDREEAELAVVLFGESGWGW